MIKHEIIYKIVTRTLPLKIKSEAKVKGNCKPIPLFQHLLEIESLHSA